MPTQLEFPLKVKIEEKKELIFCQVRKKYVVLTPEEWVRQHVLYLLKNEKDISFSRMAVERQVTGSNKRFDIVIHNKETGLPTLIIECKRQKENLSQKTFDQISRYNQQLNVPYLVITNWKDWLAAEVNETGYRFLEAFPEV